MVELQIACLGELQVTRAGTVVTLFHTDKHRALLPYLALEPRVHTRAELAQFFWPGYSDESARNSLRQALHQLRQTLGDAEAARPWLLLTRQTVQLNPDAPIPVDVLTFRHLLATCASHAHAELTTCAPCLARLHQAVDLYRGDFLAGFSVADSAPFEEWRRVIQEQLHIQALDALTDLVAAAEAAGDDAQALHAAQRLLTLEPWLEAAHRQVMRILAQRGQRAAAIAQYNRCRQVLAEEFNAEPDGATLALYQQIVDGRFDTALRRLSDLAKASVDSGAEALAEDDDERSSSQTEPQQARASLALPSHYLPASPYAIVGRAEEMATILTHLQSAQLLTLMGSGGMGKTRLALEIGRQLLSGYVDGVWFVALAPVSSPSAIAMTVATTMGLVLQGNDPNAALCQLLRHKQLLLILDNFEHLLGEETALDLVVDLLAAAPGVQILVTSRERLKLRDEQLYPLSALPFSPASTLAEAAASPAVHLFVLALQRVQTNFQLTAANLAVVLRICQLVQGMPLGLELAAANSRGMPLSAIADAIAHSADFLGVDWRDLPERQRSMRAVFAWSWRLLSATEQRVLRQSAIFRGGFDYSAAQAVLGVMSAVLTALVDKSLLQWQAAATGEGRYAMHELLRQLAEEQLQAVTEEYAAVATRHSDYYLAFVAAQEQRIVRHELRQATDVIQSEIDNIRQAWHWAATQTNIDVLGAAAYVLWQFYAMRGSRAESEQMLRLATAAGLPSAAFDDQALPQNWQRSLSKLLALHADTLVVQGKYGDAAATARQAMTLGRRSNGHEGESYGAAVLGQALTHMNHFDDSRAVTAEALHLVQRYTSDSAASAFLDQAAWVVYENLAFLTFEAGDYSGARAYMRQSLQRAQARGHQHQERVCLYYLAQYAGSAGDYATALPEYEQSLALMRSLGDQLGEAYTLIGVAQACRLQGAYTRAQRVLAQGLDLAHQLGDVFCQITALADLSRLHCLLGKAPHVGPWLTQLAQLLAQRELNPGRRLYGLDLLAFHALTIGEGPQALAYAEEAAHLAQGYIGYGQARALVTLGQARAYNQQWAIAQVAYQQAVDGYAKLNNARLAVDPRTGLAQIALAQGDLAQARAWVESFLPVLVSEPRAGFNSPFFAYWVGYQVFAANRDPRAATLLQQGYDLLHQDAAALDDESRQRFLTGVTIHREIVTAYEGMKETEAGKIRDTLHETGNGFTSPAPVPLSSVPLSAIRDWAEMPAVDFFVEWTAEVAQLTAWLTAPADGAVPAQLISILGMGGMGKTTLAALVTRAVASSFAVVIWRSLLNAPPLSELLRNWLQILSRQSLTVLPESLDEQLRLLLTYLQQERSLLVLDNVESIFAADESKSRAGVSRPGYEGYDQLFQRLASSDHQSCLLLTSREQPYALLRSGRQAQTTGRLQVLQLAGLDQQAGQVLLQSNGIHASAAEAAQLVENYSGNPLALQIVAATIADFFNGDVAAFQQEAGQIFDGMRLVLDQQFARLSPLEREILIWLAIEREPISVPTLRSNLVQPVATAPLLEALQALQNRSLLEKRESGFTLQNVIIEYTTDYLVEQVYQEIYEFRIPISDFQASLPDAGRVNLKSKIENLFLNRFALVKAQAREEVRQSQVRLLLQPLASRLLAHLRKAQVEERVMALVQQLQATVPLTLGYAGGNLLNLLLHIGSDLRGRDFSHLVLWQVFLAGAYAPGLNLAGADLTGTVFTQRFGTLHDIQFDDHGDLLLADIHDQRLRLLRLRDGQLYQEVALPALRFTLPYLSPGCESVFMTTADDQLTLLDLKTGTLSPVQTRHQHPIWRVCFSPDGRLVASGDSSGLVCIWHRQSGQLVQARQISTDAVSALAIAPDGETIASATVAGTVFLWSLTDESALRRLQGHDDEVATLVFLDNGRLLASGSHDLTVGLWDVAAGELRQRLRGHTRPVRKIGAAPTGQWLVTGGGDHFLYVWDWQRGAPHHLLADHASSIDHLVISADGKQAATRDLNTVVSLWDLAQGRRIDYYAIYYNAIMSIQFSSDGETLVTGGSDGAVYLWQMDKEVGLRLTARLTAHKHRIFGVALHPDGNLIASAGDNAGIALWEQSSGRLLQTLQGHTKNIAMLDFSADGKWLANGNGDGTVTLWSMPTGRQQRQLQLHTNLVSCCAFSPSRGDALGQPQQRLASGSLDHTLAIWDAGSGALLHHLRGHTNAIGRCLFSHDGRRLISTSYDETLRIWDVESGQLLTTWQQLGGGYIALALHPAGALLAVSCTDHRILLLELTSGRCLAELHGHSLTVISLAFHPTQHLLASAGSDETIRLWDISSAALQTGQIACLHTLQAPGPYAGMNISGVTGISEAQKAALRALGAVES